MYEFFRYRGAIFAPNISLPILMRPCWVIFGKTRIKSSDSSSKINLSDALAIVQIPNHNMRHYNNKLKVHRYHPVEILDHFLE